MPVQALFLDEVHNVLSLSYEWAEDGTVLLALDCVGSRAANQHRATMTFSDLHREISALCPWQKTMQVTIGTKHAFAEVLTVYHAFESAKSMDSLMLVSTPPDEYFEAA